MTKSKSLGIVLCCLFLLLAAKPHAASLSYTGSSLWQHVNDVVLDDKWAYCALSFGLRIVDISDTPGIASETYFQGEGAGLVKSGNFVYLADDYGGLKIISVSNVYTPVLVGEYLGDRPIRKVAVEDTVAYLSASPGKLDIVNVADPSRPSLIARYDFADAWTIASALAISNHRLFVATWSGVMAFDVSDPTLPVLKSSLPIPTGPAGLAVRGQYLYAAAQAEVEGFQGAIWSADVANLSGMVLLDSIAVSGDATDLALQDTLLIAATSQGVLYANVADPYNLIKLTSLPLSFRPAQVSADGSATLAAGSNNGGCGHKLCRINHQNPTSPNLELIYPMPLQPFAVGIADHYALVGTMESTLYVLDLSFPGHPTLVNMLSLPGQLGHITISGNYAYVCAYLAGIYILDISDPGHPTLLTHYDTPSSASRVVIQDTLAYIADWRSMQIINVSNPASPTPVGSWADSSQGWITSDVVAADTIAYVAMGYGGLQMINCKNPAAPFRIGQIAGGGLLAVNGNLMVALGASKGLRVYDIANPGLPVQLSYYDSVSNASIAFTGNSIFAVTRETSPYGYDYGINGLHVIDISAPTVPILVARYPLSGTMQEMAVADDRVIVAEYGGLLALHYACCVGATGNVDGDPYDGADISDITALIDHLYISLLPLTCEAEADVDRSGNVDISDLTLMIDALYISLGPLPACP